MDLTALPDVNPITVTYPLTIISGDPTQTDLVTSTFSQATQAALLSLGQPFESVLVLVSQEILTSITLPFTSDSAKTLHDLLSKWFAFFIHSHALSPVPESKNVQRYLVHFLALFISVSEYICLLDPSLVLPFSCQISDVARTFAIPLCLPLFVFLEGATSESFCPSPFPTLSLPIHGIFVSCKLLQSAVLTSKSQTRFQKLLYGSVLLYIAEEFVETSVLSLSGFLCPGVPSSRATILEQVKIEGEEQKSVDDGDIDIMSLIQGGSVDDDSAISSSITQLVSRTPVEHFNEDDLEVLSD
ncbi:hypothetical protein RCL1_006085 [Eukaryota sp. TZLM3-RCL]